MIALSVNLNKIALLRNSRAGDYPSVAAFARSALRAGAHGLTVHPRPDQRHIRPADVHQLAAIAKDEFGVEFNIEGNPFAAPRGDYPGLLELVARARPHQVTLVPDSDAQLTSDHGFDLDADSERLRPIIDQCHALGARVSLFMDPLPAAMAAARAVGADRIELYTGPYALAAQADAATWSESLARYSAAAQAATEAGLGVNAGHDLNLDNLTAFCRAVAQTQEVSIGHALTVDALERGFENAVRAYLGALEAAV